MSPSPDDAGCLDLLFAPLTRDAFLDAHWPGRPAVAHGPVERFGSLGFLPAFESIDALLATFREPVRVVLAGARDEHDSVLVDAVAASRLHANGLALVLDGMERYVPAVEAWLGQLRVELGLPAHCNPRSIVYASPKGGGNSAHFDANANVVLQLQGHKRWHLAPNRHVRNPTDRWAMNQSELPEELAGIMTTPLPTELPAHADVVDLVPGSVLFVPRGYWHATEALEDSLSLNFTFGQPTYADVVLAALRRRLLSDASWRALPEGLASTDPVRAEAARERLAVKLAGLGDEVRALGVEDVAGPRAGSAGSENSQ